MIVQPESQQSQTRHAAEERVGLSTRNVALVLLGALALVWAWHWNYNLLGDFYDYSIFASSSGYLHHGLRPYRDFTTSLQSLPIYLSYGAELLFGPRYLSLAYANLLMGLVFYGATLLTLRGFPMLMRVLVAAALCVATFFQHGILWYNPLAMMLLALTVWQSALIARKTELDKARVMVLCVLILLSSMVKANFHLVGLATFFAALAWRFAKARSGTRTQFMWIVPLALASGIILGPTIEVWVNGTTFHDFFQQVFRTPKGRLRDVLPQLVQPSLYLNKAHDFYPDNFSSGIYLTGALIFGLCIFAAVSDKVTDGTRNSPAVRLWLPALLVAQFFCSLLLTASNHDLQVLTASYLIVGLVAVQLLFSQSMGAMQRRSFHMAIALLSALFLIAGGASSFRHSRLRYLEDESVSGKIDDHPISGGYLNGVRLTQTAALRMARINSFIQKRNLAETPEKIFWGPGLEMLNRVCNLQPKGHLPLWYDANATINESDSSRIIDALKQNNPEWFVASETFVQEMPQGVLRFLHQDFELIDANAKSEGIIILHRRAQKRTGAQSTNTSSFVSRRTCAYLSHASRV